MCWNAEVSLQTFTFTIICFIIAYIYNYPLNKLIFLMVFSSMQLVEYFLWKNIDNKKKNEFYSKIGLLVILLEPLAGINMIENTPLKINLSFFYLWITFIYLLLNYKNINFSTTIGKKGFLKWNWLDVIYPNQNIIHSFYFILWTFFLFYSCYLTKDWIILVIGIFTYLYSWYNYTKYDAFGTYWCYIVNFIWICVIIQIIYKNFILNGKNKNEFIN